MANVWVIGRTKSPSPNNASYDILPEVYESEQKARIALEKKLGVTLTESTYKADDGYLYLIVETGATPVSAPPKALQ